jgi:hypothetical protein
VCVPWFWPPFLGLVDFPVSYWLAILEIPSYILELAGSDDVLFMYRFHGLVVGASKLILNKVV